jgi:hypothetical protein
MITFTGLQKLFGQLSLNASTDNLDLGATLINNEHRYLLQKYFANERTATTTTVGSSNLTSTAPILAGATSATLSASWTLPTGSGYVTFSDAEQREVLFTNGSTAISWADQLTGSVTTSLKFLGFQFYNIPANVSKIINNTINVGQLKFQTVPIMSRTEWDTVNFLPYNSDIPAYNYIYNGQLGIFPIPSTTGNILTFNYKTKVADLTYSDVTAGTLATMTAGSTVVTGTGTTWNTVFPVGVNISSQNLYIKADVSTGGDGLWYPIRQFNSATSLTLDKPVISAPAVTVATTYTIGQLPLLSEDFQDMLVYGALVKYFGSVVDNPGKLSEAQKQYDTRLELLAEYDGTKQVNVDLEAVPNQLNPNLFLWKN